MEELIYDYYDKMKLTERWEVIQWPSFNFPMPVTSLEVKIDYQFMNIGDANDEKLIMKVTIVMDVTTMI